MKIFTLILSHFSLPQSVSILQGEMVPKILRKLTFRDFIGLFYQILISKTHVDFKIYSADRDGSFDTHIAIFSMSFMSRDMCHKMPENVILGHFITHVT